MYAIIEVGGKQFRVEEGDVIDVELLKSIADGTVNFTNILLLNSGSSIKVGLPFLEKCLVQAEYIEEVKGPKVIAYKYKKRKNYSRKVGHRQKYSRIKITKIEDKGE